MSYKIYLNKNLHILGQCAKSVLKNYFFLATLVLFILGTITYCVILDSYRNLNFNDYLSKSKTLHQIYFIVDFVFIFLINLALINILFSQHIKSGLYSIEKRSGVKIREIFLVRLMLVFILSFFILTLLMLLKLLALISVSVDRTYITVDKVMFSYLANIIFSLLIINMLIICIFLFNRVIAIVVTIIFISLNVISPFIFNISYVGSIANTQSLLNLRDRVSTNVKLNIGKRFSDFVSENEEYVFLVDEYDELNVTRDNPTEQKVWELYERIFYFGDIKNEEVVSKIDSNLKIIEMINAISGEYKYKNESKTCSWNQLMFNKPNNQFCDPASFLKKAVKSNISNGKYNKLFNYFINEFDNFFIMNEMVNSTSWKSIHLTGTIFEYGLFDKGGEVNINSFQKDYVDPGEVTFYWLLFQTLRYSITLDSEQIRTLYKPQPNFTNYTVFNVFNYLPYIYNGSSINNKIFDDIYAVNGISFVQAPKHSYKTTINDDFKKYSSNSGKSSDIRFAQNRVSKNELSTIGLGSYNTTMNYALITSLYSLVVISFSYVSYVAYKRVWND
ncbi:hypothetical protein [Spiroplasma endosymbiont of Othius punctulatus]|uniref:hypothetical protein n=1 Tax=Spiroplasma endosymbiont of Othius punctulatus TaxID=3066289 RepID=UPI0030CBC278